MLRARSILIEIAPSSFDWLRMRFSMDFLTLSLSKGEEIPILLK
jgi:hypothetical protein